jgi:hypothetical protein
MQCPYCISEVPEQALACPHCARDLYLFRPLLQNMAAMERTLAEQKQQISALETKLAALEQRPRQTAAGSAPAAQGSMTQALIPYVVIPLLLILLAHWILLFIYDVNPLFLRITTLVIPIPFGVALALRAGMSLGSALMVAAVVGICAVSGMLGLTTLIDKVPFLPSSTRDWRETVEYVGGIGGAFFTGCLIAHAIAVARNAQTRTPSPVIVLAVKAFKPNDKGEIAIEVMARQIQRLVNTATPALTGAAAFYAGIRGVIGGG